MTRIGSTNGLHFGPAGSLVARPVLELDPHRSLAAAKAAPSPPERNDSAGAESTAVRLAWGDLSRRDLARASGLRVQGSLRG